MLRKVYDETEYKKGGVFMEKNQLRQEHPLVSGVRQSRFIPFWWLAPFICYGLTKFGRELGKLLAAPIIDSNVGVLD